ncbi:MAG: transporter substrate-binding domain-containing protein [Bacteroidales bacterium]|nr:transporter substrate-binding domain-containing protein [Bacteroidales bacterium]
MRLNHLHVFAVALSIAVLLFLSACENKVEPLLETISNDTLSSLDVVLSKGRIKVLTDYNSVNYYIYRGEPMGFQYELLKAFSNHLGVRLELNVENNLLKAKRDLEEGNAQMIALGMTVTGERMIRYDFSDPILITRQVLIQRMPKNWQQMRTRDEIEKQLLRNSLEFAGLTIHVQKGSIFKKRLETLADEIGDTIYIIEDNRDVEELIGAVSRSEIDFTIADEHMATVLLRNFSNLDIKTPVSFQQKIAWALRKEQNNELLAELNEWLRNFQSSTSYRLLYDKYFGEGIRNRSRSEFHSFTGGKLSQYDETIRKVANEIDWDWRLLASLIYQESEFKHQVTSWAGAFGLMQLMPAVMEQFGIDTASAPEEHIRVGGKYLLYLDRMIPESVTDINERKKFLLASYNSGVGHVLDARRLAAKYNKNPDIWTDNVDFFMRNKSRPAFYNDPASYYGYVRGEETFLFVEQIIDRFEHYKNLIGP